MVGMKRKMAVAVMMAMVFGTKVAFAAGLGIPLDGFLATFQTWVVGLGLVMGLVGLSGYIGALFDNPFAHILSGSLGFFTKAGLLGGGTVLMGLLGLVGGATV